MTLTPAVRGNTKATMASHFRRLHTAMTVSRPDPFRVSSVIPRWSSPLLRHQDDVAGLQVKIRLIRLAGDDLVVVEGNSCDRRAARAQDDDALPRRELGEAAGEGEDVQHGGRGLE